MVAVAWLAACFEFDVVLGGELEDLGRRGDLRLRGPQDRVRLRRPPGGQGVTEDRPARVFAWWHPVLPLAGFLAERLVLGGKVVDPGDRLGELAVAFGVAGGCGFGGEQRLDPLAGVAAAQFGVGGDGQVPGGGGGVLPVLPVGHGLGEGVFALLVGLAQGPVAGGQTLLPCGAIVVAGPGRA